MSWFSPLSEALKKRACRYLLHHYLGSFLLEKISLEQLTIDLYKGSGSVKNVNLDVQALNDILQKQNVPVDLVDGFIGEILVTVPWSSLLSDSTQIEICGLELTFKPRGREDVMISSTLLDSMISSMVTSMELAEGCIRETKDDVPTLEGLKLFAHTIDTVLSRIRINFKKSVLRLEHRPIEATVACMALELHIDRVEYLDALAELEVDVDSRKQQPTPPMSDNSLQHQLVVKHLRLMGVSLHFEHFDNAVFDIRQISVEKPTSLVKIGHLCGRQEVHFKLKASDSLPGARLQVDLVLNGTHILLSPHQVHHLFRLAQVLQTPAANSSIDSNPHLHTFSENRPLCDRDLQCIEHQLSSFSPYGDLPMDEPLSQDTMFFSANHFPLTTDEITNFNCGPSSIMTSSQFTSTTTTTGGILYFGSDEQNQEVSASTQNQRSHYRLNRFLEDKPTEVTSVRLRLRFLTLTLLHEEPTATPFNGIDPEITALQKISLLSNAYFNRIACLDALSMCDDDSNDALSDNHRQGANTLYGCLPLTGATVPLRAMRDAICKFCVDDHIGLVVRGVQLDVSQKETRLASTLNCRMVIAAADLLEVLFERKKSRGLSMPFPEDARPSYAELIAFPDLSLTSLGCVRLEMTSIERHRAHFDTELCRTEMRLELEAFTSELDMSIVDRAHTLLHPNLSDFLPQSNIYAQFQSLQPNLYEDNSSPNCKYTISVVAPSALLYVRFPVPDLRQGQERLAWWRRNLRSEYLALQVNRFEFNTSFNSGDSVGMYEVMCSELHALLHSPNLTAPLSLLRAASAVSSVESMQDCDAVVQKLRLVVRSYPKNDATQNILLSTANAAAAKSMKSDSHLESLLVKEAARQGTSPFGTRSDMYDNEELTRPGSRVEMLAFHEECRSNSLFVIDVDVPRVNVLLHDKDFLEIVYNRIFNDLVLWEPLAPAPANIATSTFCAELPMQFTMCGGAPTSQQQQLDEHLSSDEEADSMHQMYSLHDAKGRHLRSGTARVPAQNRMCFSLCVGQARIHARLPRCDEKDDPDDVSVCREAGEALLNLTDTLIFMEVAHDNDPTMNYITVQANRLTLHHAPCRTVTARSLGKLDKIQLEPIVDECSDSGWMRTLFSSCASASLDSASEDMLSVAISVRETRKSVLKETLLAVALSDAIWRYRMWQPEQCWITQLSRLFNLKDFDVYGYTPCRVVTTLHTELCRCALAYQPMMDDSTSLLARLRVMLSADLVHLSSHIVAEAQTSTLSVLVEESSLALALESARSTVSLDLRRDYVCVAHMGHFQMTLRLAEAAKNLRSPKVDLTILNDELHLRTCVDSCHLLTLLLQHLASDGDLPAVSESTQMQAAEAPMSSTSTTIPSLSQAAISCMNSQLEDAIDDFDNDNAFVDHKQQHAQHPERRQQQKKQQKCVEREEDGFCIVEEFGLGLNIASNGQPTVYQLTDDPIYVQDNYFCVPTGRVDLLRDPDGYPPAVYRYSASDVSVTWYIYAGSDFDTSQASYLLPTPALSTLNSSPAPPRDWRVRGGPPRAHHCHMAIRVSKALLRHSVYAENVAQAQRQVVFVHEVEILDRICTSNVAKFLYRFSSDTLPRQTSAHMLVLKASHVRSELGARAGLAGTPECSLRISLQPLRLNIDQDAFNFLRYFFSALVAPSSDDGATSTDASGLPSSSGATPHSLPPVCDVGSGVGVLASGVADSVCAHDSLNVVFDELEHVCEVRGTIAQNNEGLMAADRPLFFKSLLFSPDVYIRLDYHGHRLDLEQGAVLGVLAGLAQLNKSELRLRRLHNRSGLLGLHRVIAFVLHEWLSDLRANQLPALLLASLGPMQALLHMLNGLRDLVWLPVQQYRRDGRILKGLQRGAASCAQSTGAAALQLSGRFLEAVHAVASFTREFLSPLPLSHQRRLRGRDIATRRNVPADLREGLHDAAIVFQRGLTETRDNWNLAHSEGTSAVLRQMVPTMVMPLEVAADAGVAVLDGIRYQLCPESRREEEDMWK